MFHFDVNEADIDPTVTLSDASTQDHSFLDSQFDGVINDLSWMWAMVDTENGKRYQINRCLGVSGTFDFTVHECYPDLFEYPRILHAPGQNDLYYGPTVWLPLGDGKHQLITANATMAQLHPLTITLSPEQYTWQEDDVNVVITPLPNNVTVIDVPGRPDPVCYTSSAGTVTGSIEGSPIVGGYGGYDRMYSLPGLSCQISKMANLEHYWFVWYNELEDGTWETGNCMLGAGGYATASLNREGEKPLIATNAQVVPRVLWDEKNGTSEPWAAELTFGGETFDFSGIYNCAACVAALGIHWIQGTAQRRGGPESLRSYWTMEVIKRGLASDGTTGPRAKPRH